MDQRWRFFTEFQSQAANIFYFVYCFFIRLITIENIIEMKGGSLHESHAHTAPSQTAEKSSQGSLVPIIPIKSDLQVKSKIDATTPTLPAFANYPQDEKIIPGYNFQSLFRKKSHIRLARKKHKEESEKRSSHVKMQASEKEEKNIQKGHWTTEENKRYHWFLEIHSRHFIFKYLRRTDKIFKNMASFIGTRQAEQCRSHHQKMEKKYHTFYQILLKLRMDFYNTANPEELRVDLEESGFKMKDSGLITEDQLKNGDIKKQSKNEEDRELDSLNNSSEDDNHSEKHQNNLLNQNYENNLDFHIPY